RAQIGVVVQDDDMRFGAGSDGGGCGKGCHREQFHGVSLFQGATPIVDVAAQHAPDDPLMADTPKTGRDRKPFADIR
ncbi:hypothetical protein OY671_010608, partial [Metschnikowia pulcherrima]